jgi:hypothetical protein
MKKDCSQCQANFEVTESDIQFLDDISPIIKGQKYLIPPPTLCPSCRLQRRLAFRCQTAIFQRTSHPHGQKILSMHPESAPFPVMSNEDYFKDDWDALNYGQPFSFNKPFFEQFADLNSQVPKYARIAIRNENSEYCNNLSDNRNCYLTFNCSQSEDIMYCETSWGCKDCLECTNILHCERCYDCVNCSKCYDLQSSEYSENCSESLYLAFCKNVRKSFGCINLRNKEYCIFNEQKTPEEFQKFMSQFHQSSYQERQKYRAWFEEFVKQHPRPHLWSIQTEDCNGNFLTECRNVTKSTFIDSAENMKHCFHIYEGADNCQDYSFFGKKASWVYESSSCGIDLYRIAFCIQARDTSSNLLYCYGCDSSQDCFGCVSLKKKQYCILNKQYTKDEYENLVSKIIEHMKNDGGGAMNPTTGRRSGSWGEFFPMSLSPLPYNRSIAHRYFPLNKGQVTEQGLTWHEEDPKEFTNMITSDQLPDAHPDSNNPITIQSQLSGRPFKIIEQEIKACKKFRVPLPRQAYEERMDERAKKLGDINLYSHHCAKTGKPITTPYPPDSPYIIWDRAEYENHFN